MKTCHYCKSKNDLYIKYHKRKGEEKPIQGNTFVSCSNPECPYNCIIAGKVVKGIFEDTWFQKLEKATL